MVLRFGIMLKSGKNRFDIFLGDFQTYKKSVKPPDLFVQYPVGHVRPVGTSSKARSPECFRGILDVQLGNDLSSTQPLFSKRVTNVSVANVT